MNENLHQNPRIQKQIHARERNRRRNQGKNKRPRTPDVRPEIVLSSSDKKMKLRRDDGKNEAFELKVKSILMNHHQGESVNIIKHASLSPKVIYIKYELPNGHTRARVFKSDPSLKSMVWSIVKGQHAPYDCEQIGPHKSGNYPPYTHTTTTKADSRVITNCLSQLKI